MFAPLPLKHYPLQPFPVDALCVLSSCQVYEKVAYLLTNLGEHCPHAFIINTHSPHG